MKKYFPIFLIILITAILFLRSQEASLVTMTSAQVIINHLFPAIFPFLIFTNLLIMVGGAKVIGYFLQYLSVPLFNISGEAAVLLLIGTISGFPASAIYGAQILKTNPEQKEQIQRIINYVFFPSFNFVTVTIAFALNDYRTALLLLISLYLSSFFLLFLAGAFAKEKRAKIQSWSSVIASKDKVNWSETIRQVIMQSTKAFMIIGGVVLLFSLPAHFFIKLAPLPSQPFLLPLLEISTGILLFIQNNGPHLFLPAYLSFSSFSVITQAAAALSGSKIKIGSFICARWHQALIAVFIFAILTAF